LNQSFQKILRPSKIQNFQTRAERAGTPCTLFSLWKPNPEVCGDETSPNTQTNNALSFALG